MNFHFQVDTTVNKLLSVRSKELPVKLNTKVRHFAQLLKTRIQANASGRPGPNAPTGDYRRSWTVEVKGGADIVEAEVGTNKPQGRRLEYGFHGADSLGRVYNQPPFPHVGPAVDWLEGQVEKEFEELANL
jgi:hypothetical protein